MLATDGPRGELIKALDAAERHFGSLRQAGVAGLERIRGEAKAVELAMKPLANIPMRIVFSGAPGIGGGGGLGVVDDYIPQIPRSSLMKAIVDPLVSAFAGIDATTIGAKSANARVNAGVQEGINASGKSFWQNYLDSGLDQALGQLEDRITNGLARAFRRKPGRSFVQRLCNGRTKVAPSRHLHEEHDESLGTRH